MTLASIRQLSSRETRVMANVLILGGGFGGVVAAETLATNLSREH
jgi:heterodisulfide reductase subunit A-like polyferredoxin